jgi:hypothetical protein
MRRTVRFPENNGPVISALLILLLTLHLLCVNVASGGPILGAWLDWRGSRGDEAAAQAARYFGRASFGGLVVGALLGLLIGWLKWDAAYRALWLGSLSYRLHWAGIEALFSLVLIAAWWRWLPGRCGGGRWQMVARSFIALLAATNLLYHFPILFAVATQLSDAAQASREELTSAAFRRLMISGMTPALAIHVTLASVAVSGMVLIGLATRYGSRGEQTRAARIARWGGYWSLAPSVLQLPVGLWVLASLPATLQQQLMGTDTVATLLLVVAIAAALWLINDLVHISLGELSRPILMRAMTAMLLTVLLMIAMQQLARPTPVRMLPASAAPRRSQPPTAEAGSIGHDEHLHES